MNRSAAPGLDSVGPDARVVDKRCWSGPGSMIRLERLGKTYERESVSAVRGISLCVDEGEAVALMGPSGCGKTTLLNLIAAMEQRSSGEIFVGGRPLEDYRPYHRYRAELIGFIFQFHHLVPALTLLENVELPMYARRVSAPERKKRASDLLESIGLASRMHAYPNRVSGGERQRAAIARSLANHPSLILADEPTGSVDSVTGEQVVQYLLEYCRGSGSTLLMVTHNAAMAALLDRVVTMQDGQLAGA